MEPTDTNEKKTRVVTLTGRPPVTIVEDDWPIIASARRHDGDKGIASNAARRWYLTVRRHADGRTLVYGRYDTNWQRDQARAAGELVPKYDGQAVTEAIRKVAAACGEDDWGDELAEACIAKLPPEVL